MTGRFVDRFYPLLRLGAFVAISVATVWLVLMVVSLGLGTTEFGTTPAMRASVHAWAAWLMWIAVAIAILHLVIDLIFWLLAKLGL